MISPPISRYPDCSRKFILTTDASNGGVREFLSQGEIGKYLPIVFASRSLNKVERNYRKGTSSHCMENSVFQAVAVRNKIYCSNRSQTPPWIIGVKDPGNT
jgi:hypothetical protein